MKDDDQPLSINGYIKTDVQLGLDGKFPVMLPYEGLAKSLEVAMWMFAYCGWKRPEHEYPCLGYEIARIEWPEGDQYFPCDNSKLYILSGRVHPLIMN